MIWIRRILTLPLGLLLLFLLFIVVFTLQVSGTFLNPGFYPKELSKANVYEFVLVDLTTSALDEARELTDEDLLEGLEENPLVTLGLSTEDIVLSLNRSIPPEWVQGIVEQVFEELGRYIAGRHDEFEVTIQAGDRVVTMVDEAKFLLRKADAYNILFEEVAAPAAEDAVDVRLPFGLEVTSDRLVTSVRRVISPEWVQENVEAALDELTPYVVGDRDTFRVNVRLAERVEIAIREVKQLLRESDAYAILYDEVIEPAIVDALGGTVELPFGTMVTSEEISAALRRVAPPEWVQEQAELVIDAASPYFTGEQEGFSVIVSLVDNKREARAVMEETVTRKFREVVDALPECTAAQLLAQITSGDLVTLPECLPPGVELGQLVQDLAPQVVDAVEPSILGLLPDSVTFTETVLRETLVNSGAGDNLDLIDDMRQVIGDGWTYTSDDLREDIRNSRGGVEAVARLDDGRDFLADGWTYTHIDFRDDIVELGGEDALVDFDQGRDIFSLTRTFRYLVYLPVILLLVLIGFLGGRSWSGRLGWAASFLLVSSAVLIVTFGPVYSAVADSQLEDARETALEEIKLDSNFENTERLALNKVFDIGESVADGLASGIATKSLILLGLSVIALAVAFRGRDALERYRSRSRSP